MRDGPRYRADWTLECKSVDGDIQKAAGTNTLTDYSLQRLALPYFVGSGITTSGQNTGGFLFDTTYTTPPDQSSAKPGININSFTKIQVTPATKSFALSFSGLPLEPNTTKTLGRFALYRSSHRYLYTYYTPLLYGTISPTISYTPNATLSFYYKITWSDS